MDLSKVYTARAPWVHKGAYGSVLVIAGSKLYSGSATLAAGGALRSGVDLVTVCAPVRAADIAASKITDLITYPLKGDYLVEKHVKDIFEIVAVRRINSVVLGPGLGRHRLTVSAIYKLISKFTIPMVLDADALFAISRNPQIVSGKHLILTPHAQEAAMLLGREKIEDDFDSRLAAGREVASKYHSVVLLKGHIDIITDGEQTITNNSGSVFMTKGGFGDILAGVVGALLARNVGLFEAAHVGAYISGRAGQIAASYFGEGLIASDALAYIPQVIHSS